MSSCSSIWQAAARAADAQDLPRLRVAALLHALRARARLRARDPAAPVLLRERAHRPGRAQDGRGAFPTTYLDSLNERHAHCRASSTTTRRPTGRVRLRHLHAGYIDARAEMQAINLYY